VDGSNAALARTSWKSRDLLIGAGLSVAAALLFFAWLYWGRTTQVLIAVAAGVGGLAMIRYPEILAGVLGFSVVSYIASFLPGSTAALLGFCAVVLLLRRLIAGEFNWRLGWFFVVAAAFGLWYDVAIIWADSACDNEWMDGVKIILSAAIVAELISNRQNYLAYFVGGAAGLVFASIMAIRSAYTFFTAGAAEELSQHVAYVGSTRFFGNWSDPNIMSMTFVTFLGVTFSMWRSKLDYRLRWLAFAATALGFATILLSLSRGGLISCVIIFLTMLAVDRRKLRMVTAVAAVVIIVVLFSPTDIFGRVAGMLEGDKSAGERGMLIINGWNAFWENPVFGSGLGSIAHTAPFAQNLAYLPHNFISHNTVVDLAVDLGIVGLLLFGFALYLAYRGLDWKTWKIDHSNPNHVINAGLRGGLLASSFSMLTISSAAYIPFWIFFTICALFKVTNYPKDSAAARTPR